MLPRFKRITTCRFITQFTKNYNLQRFKELQYVDLNLIYKELLIEKW